jgi:hypothetical protein
MLWTVANLGGRYPCAAVALVRLSAFGRRDCGGDFSWQFGARPMVLCIMWPAGCVLCMALTRTLAREGRRTTCLKRRNPPSVESLLAVCRPAKAQQLLSFVTECVDESHSSVPNSFFDRLAGALRQPPRATCQRANYLCPVRFEGNVCPLHPDGFRQLFCVGSIGADEIVRSLQRQQSACGRESPPSLRVRESVSEFFLKAFVIFFAYSTGSRNAI